MTIESETLETDNLSGQATHDCRHLLTAILEAVREGNVRLRKIERKIEGLSAKENVIMAQEDDLKAGIANVKTLIEKTGTDILSLATRIDDKLKAAGTPVDLSSEIADLNALGNEVSGFDTQVLAFDPDNPSGSASAGTSGAATGTAGASAT